MNASWFGTILDLFASMLAPGLPRGLAPRPLLLGVGFMGFILVLIAVSTQPWALATYPYSHNAFFDETYEILDPTVFYLITGYLTFLLLVRPRGQAMWPSQKRLLLLRILHAGVLFGLATFLIVFMEGALKRGLGRARPVTRIEHSLIAARIEGWLKDDQAAKLKAEQFECPVGRLVFDPGFRRGNGGLVEQLVERKLLSEREARDHVRKIQRRIGIGPYEQDIVREIASFNEIAPWRQKQIRPFFAGLIGISSDKCDVNGGAPSGHVLRQSFVLFVFLLVAFNHVGLSLRRWKLQWKLLLALQIFALFVSVWTRVYSYEHTLSDELLSFALTIGLLSIAQLVRRTSIAFQEHLLLEMVTPQMIDLLQAVRLLVVIVDRDGAILIWNREAERVTGYSHREMSTLADYVRNLYPDSDQSLILARKQRLMSDARQEKNVITMITPKVGQRKLITWNGAALCAPDGSVFGRFSIGIEVNSMDRRLADLGAGTMSILHDVRREVGRLRHWAGLGPVPKVNEVVDRLWAICEDHRAYVKGDSGRQAINAGDLVGFVIQVTRDDAEAANVVLRKNVPANLPPLYGHYQLLRHALTDLVHNAVKAIAAMNRSRNDDPLDVWIVARHIRKDAVEYVRLEVADNGPGLPPPLKMWLSSGPTMDGGDDRERELGLGLMLASIAAREHGGWIEHSEEDGKNVISITVPVFPPLDQQQSVTAHHTLQTEI